MFFALYLGVRWRAGEKRKQLYCLKIIFNHAKRKSTGSLSQKVRATLKSGRLERDLLGVKPKQKKKQIGDSALRIKKIRAIPALSHPFDAKIIKLFNGQKDKLKDFTAFYRLCGKQGLTESYVRIRVPVLEKAKLLPEKIGGDGLFKNIAPAKQKETANTVFNLFKQGSTIRELADKYDVSGVTLRKFLIDEAKRRKEDYFLF